MLTCGHPLIIPEGDFCMGDNVACHTCESEGVAHLTTMFSPDPVMTILSRVAPKGLDELCSKSWHVASSMLSCPTCTWLLYQPVIHEGCGHVCCRTCFSSECAECSRMRTAVRHHVALNDIITASDLAPYLDDELEWIEPEMRVKVKLSPGDEILEYVFHETSTMRMFRAVTIIMARAVSTHWLSWGDETPVEITVGQPKPPGVTEEFMRILQKATKTEEPLTMRHLMMRIALLVLHEYPRDALKDMEETVDELRALLRTFTIPGYGDSVPELKGLPGKVEDELYKCPWYIKTKLALRTPCQCAASCHVESESESGEEEEEEEDLVELMRKAWPEEHQE